jgi:hypothetical protein
MTRKGREEDGDRDRQESERLKRREEKKREEKKSKGRRKGGEGKRRGPSLFCGVKLKEKEMGQGNKRAKGSEKLSRRERKGTTRG